MGFSGANSWKIGGFSGIFAGKKLKFVEKSADLVGFAREKSQNLRKNRLILRDFSGKNSDFEGFSGANSRFRWIFLWQISLKSTQFSL